MNEAQSQLARAAELAKGMPPLLEAGIALERSFLTALHDRDAGAARASIEPHLRAWPLIPEYERARLDTAVALADGNAEEARARLATGRALIEAMAGPRTGSLEWTVDRLAELEDRLPRRGEVGAPRGAGLGTSRTTPSASPP